MKKRITFALIIIMVAALFAPALPAYAGTYASDIEAQIAKAERELEEAKAEQEANEKVIGRGTLGFVEYMLAKDDITDKQKKDLNEAKTVLEKAMAEDFSRWSDAQTEVFPASRNNKITVIGDPYDAISLDNYETMFNCLRRINELRETDDVYVGSMKRMPAKTNFYLTAVAQTGADRAAGILNHSLLQTSCENLTSGATPDPWMSERSIFKWLMEDLGLSQLSSEEEVKTLRSESNKRGRTVGHYANLFYAVNQVMGIGFTNYNSILCFNANDESIMGNYAVYSIDEFEELYREYYATIDPELFERKVQEKQAALDRVYEAYYGLCSHSFEAFSQQADCVTEGFTGRKCSKCGYVIKDEVIPALGHCFEEGICTGCGKKTVKKINGFYWTMSKGGYRYFSNVDKQSYEEGDKVNFSVIYETATEVNYADEFVVEVSDTSVVRYTANSKSSGVMTMLKPGTVKIRVYAKDNPAITAEADLDVSDVGGHNFVIKPASGDASVTTAYCDKCKRTVEVTVPTINTVYFSNDDKTYHWTESFRFEQGSNGYVKVYLDGDNYYPWMQIKGNNDIVFDVEDESVIKYVSSTGTSCVKGVFEVLKGGTTKLTVYPKYNPDKKKVFRIIVLGDDALPVEEIKLDKEIIELDLSDEKTAKLNALVSPDNAIVKQVTWNSKNESIAKVDENGNVTAVGVGATYIRAKSLDGGNIESEACCVEVWGEQEPPEVSEEDFTVTDKMISSKLRGNYEYRIFMDGAWTEWTRGGGIFMDLSPNTEYKIAVRFSRREYYYLKEGKEKVVVIKTEKDKSVSLKYRAYVQKKGWMSWSKAAVGSTTVQDDYAGTTDNLRMETIQMQLSGAGGYVRYRAYCAKKGWTQWASTADTRTYAGTKGESRRIEMIQLQAKGQVAERYDMYYRTYCEQFGWLGWARNNEKSGSAGYARKLEAFQVRFVLKGTYFNSGTRKAFYDKSRDGANPN